MAFSDIISIFQWWLLLFVMGILFYPVSSRLFSVFSDKGYIFSKILSISVATYITFVLGTIGIIRFASIPTPLFALILLGTLIFLQAVFLKTFSLRAAWRKEPPSVLLLIVFEELLFGGALFLWSYIRSFQPDINGLEKLMDYGFINSILRSDAFPPKDMWFTPFSINYYYFGHLLTAVLTKLAAIPSEITYNLMIASLFALTMCSSFSIGYNLFANVLKKAGRLSFTCGVAAALLVTFSGNLHSVYALFSAYSTQNPVPFWDLVFSPSTFPNSYWYPNATRFIYNTIHEFPLYSFIVSDLHGHVLSIPFVLTIIALCLKAVLNKTIRFWDIVLFSFFIALCYMTNAWDAPIYFFLISLVFIYVSYRNTFPIISFLLKSFLPFAALLAGGAILFSLPFSLFFAPFASGIGVLCAPDFLVQKQHLGPFLFEAQHCQKSPAWQLLILYGFFYFWVASLFVFILKRKRTTSSDDFVLILSFISTILILIPEIIYAKDIYPAHFRANTIFKLSYQAFIMLSLSSAYISVRILAFLQKQIRKIFSLAFLFFLVGCILYAIVLSYLIFAIRGYYGSLSKTHGLNGISYLKNRYPADYEAIMWLKKNISGQPVILEAQGESFTDFSRVSSNTGLPTVLGWMVHEWLWRKTYDVPAPRIADVKTLYESESVKETKRLLRLHDVSYVFLGELERQKYQVFEKKFASLGRVTYQYGNTKIYRIN